MVAEAPWFIRWICYALFAVCPLLFFVDLTRNPYYTQIALLNVLVCVVWLIWVILAIRKNEWVWYSTPLDVPLLALILWSMITWVLSMQAHPAIRTPIYSEGSRGVIFLWINTYLVYAIAVRAQNPQLLQRLLKITYLVSVTASVYGIAQYFGTEWVWPKTLNPYGSRPVSTFGNPNFLSSYLVLVIPVMVGDYLLKSTGLPRVVLLVGILINGAALLATLTRSSWAGVLVGVFVLFVWLHQSQNLLKRGGKWFLGLLLGAGLLATLWPKNQSPEVYSGTVLSRLSEIKEFRETNYGPVWQRLLIWSAAYSMITDHPIAGKGWGCFELFYPFYQGRQLFEERFRGLRTHANNAHNEILEYTSQIGFVGIGLVFWVWVVFFRCTWLSRRRLPESLRPLQAGFVGGVAGMLADNLLNVSAHFAVPAFVLWWWVGSALLLDPGLVETHRLAWKKPTRWVVVTVSLLLLVMGAGRAVAFWRAEINFFEGFKRSKAGVDLNGAKKYLERSYAYHPLEVNNAYELGNIYARLGDRERAITMYGRALDANPGYDEIFFNRATTLMQVDRIQRAIAHYRLCLAINPMSKEAYNVLASLYMKDLPPFSQETHSLYELPAQLYEQATILFPNDRDFWNNLGWVYTQMNRYTDAQRAYQKAVTLDPRFELAQKNLAVINEKLRAVSRH